MGDQDVISDDSFQDESTLSALDIEFLKGLNMLNCGMIFEKRSNGTK